LDETVITKFNSVKITIPTAKTNYYGLEQLYQTLLSLLELQGTVTKNPKFSIARAKKTLRDLLTSGSAYITSRNLANTIAKEISSVQSYSNLLELLNNYVEHFMEIFQQEIEHSHKQQENRKKNQVRP